MTSCSSTTLVAPLAVSTISVRGPLIDVHATGSPVNYSAELVQRLPTGRSLTSILNLAPGVTEEVAFGGTQSSSNRVSIDGVGLNASYLGEQWVRPHHNWFSEVQVVAVGAPAEYGGFTGAIANGVLRSGANRYSGLADYVTVRPSWSGDNTSRLPTGARRPTPRTILGWWDLEGQSGAPIVRDRLWLFAGASYVDHEYRNFAYAGPDATHETIPRWMVKADASVAAGIQAQMFFLRDTSDIIGYDLGSRVRTFESSSDFLQRKSAWNGRVTWTPSNDTALEFRAGGHFGASSRQPRPPGERSGPSAVIDLDAQTILRNTPLYVWTDSKAVTATASVTHYLAALAGRHEFRAGIELGRSRGTEESGYTGGGVYHYAGGALVYADLWDGDRVRTRNSRATFYVQDRWSFWRLTIEPGLRMDFYQGAIPGQQTVLSTRPIGLRLGASWDVTGRHTTVLRAHYGRYHDMQFGYLYAFADRAERNPVVAARFLPDGSMREVFRLDPDQTTTVDRSLKQSHMDQFAAAVERQITSGLGLQLQYVHRRYGNFIGYVDPRIGEWRSFTVQDPGPDGRPGTQDDGGSLTGYIPYAGRRALVMSNPPDAWRHYDAIQLIGRKRLARRWQMEWSGTFSRSSGTVGTEARTNAAWSSLSPGGIGADGASRGTARRRPVHDFSEAKALATYDAPWFGGFRVGAVYRWRTGTRWHRLVIVQRPVFAIIPAEEPHSRRTPDIQQLDVRVEKTFPLLRRRARLGLYVDIFNVANLGRALGFARASGPAFGTPAGWTEPRTAQLGIRVAF
ncbi:MAG TPA: TonB-dependent receptor [Vicinamibacterales bacterium]|nr:TonB-dependent receptor [Vicinamibacterales bacterium]